MAEQSTFIKLDRNMLNWRWWKSRNTLQVFLWLLFKANVSEHDFEHQTIKRGQVVTSLKTIANSCGLSIMQVRTTLEHLNLTGEITSKSCNKYRIITIVNYDLYQGRLTSKTTGKQQTNNKQITIKQQHYKNDKNIKNEKNNNKSRSAPSSPSEKNTSHLRLAADEGTVDDIPDRYRDMFDNFADYWRWRNQ